MADDDLEHQKQVASHFPVGSLEWMVALYHDHLEDGLGDVPPAVRAHVEVLTRRSDEPYADYIARVRDSGDPVAVAVKIADAKVNLERSRGQSLEKRYRFVLRELDPEWLPF